MQIEYSGHLEHASIQVLTESSLVESTLVNDASKGQYSLSGQSLSSLHGSVCNGTQFESLHMYPRGQTRLHGAGRSSNVSSCPFTVKI